MKLKKNQKKKLPKKGQKFDSQKPPLILIPQEALYEVGKVLQKGAEKYGDFNWQNGIEVDRLLSAAQRHILQFMYENDKDEETNTLHAANAICNLMFAIWMVKNKPEFDNRRIKNESYCSRNKKT